MNQTVITAIVNALNGVGTVAASAATANPNGAGAFLAHLLHPSQSSTTGLNIKDKTMTTTFATAQPQTAAILEAQGYTITVG